jgi:hypothetical protein
MSVKIQDVADEIWREIGEPSEVVVPSIAFWLQTNVGKLNSLIFGELSLNKQDLEIANFTEDQKAIFKLMYLEYFYNKKFIETTGAAGTDQILEVSTDNHKVRKINKNELSKTYLAAKNSIQEEIKRLVNGYRFNALTPLDVSGDDTIAENEVVENR